MTHHHTLGALEEAQREAVRTAKRRIQIAEEYAASFRSQMNRMQENVYEVANQEGLADDPGFRLELQHISDEAEEELRGASRAIAGLEEDLGAMITQHTRERERFLQERRSASMGE